jgi:cytochrome c biogenesis protein CcdA
MAAEACISGVSGAAGLKILFAELDNPDAKLKPYDFDVSDMADGRISSKAAKEINTWCSKHLNASSTNSTDLTIAALVLADERWKRGYTDRIIALSTNSNPWIRRAAFYTLGRKSSREFAKLADTLAKDPSEYVRVALPANYNKISHYWTHYYSKTQTERVWSYGGSSRNKQLPEKTKELLLGMIDDPSVMIRIESYFALLSRHVPFDIRKFKTEIDALPDRKNAVKRIANFMVSGYSKLGKEFAVFLPYISEARESDEELEMVFAHFNKSRDEKAGADYTFAARSDTAPVIGSFVEGAETNDTQVAELKPMTIIFFNSPGCSVCARVEELLNRVQGSFTNMTLKTFSIKKSSSMLMNEALCDKFNVPDQLHLVAPAVFGAGGAIVKHEITTAALAELLSNSSRRDNGDWYLVEDENLNKAESTITDRYKNTSMIVVLFFGFIDGINPCAFATIIFFLSYLQVTKRRPAEILQIGTAFIVGVFLTYFALGLGLHELVTRFELLQKFGKILHWGIAGFAVVIAVLSLRDGILCLRGRMKDMSLQLPGMLKTQIHGVIRKGSRHRRFVIAALVIGIVISVLELACTGQVYLPTILFILDASPEKASAIGMLLLYNIAFIVPLVIVFGFAYSGMRSEALTKFMQKHAAPVKFATAALFMILFIIFAFGDQLKALISG